MRKGSHGPWLPLCVWAGGGCFLFPSPGRLNSAGPDAFEAMHPLSRGTVPAYLAASLISWQIFSIESRWEEAFMLRIKVSLFS